MSDDKLHRKLAVDLFNYTWELLDLKNRTAAQDEEMVHVSHASRYHWGIVGTPMNHARGEWQIARVYASLGRYTSSLHHAQLYMDACLSNEFEDWDIPFAHEGLARALLQDDQKSARMHIQKATELGEAIEKEDDRTWLQTNVHELTKIIDAN